MKRIINLSIIAVILTFAISSCVTGNCQEEPKENETINTIMNRKSVRSYTPQPVEKEKIDILVKAGLAAPSGKDIRPWDIVVIDDRALLDQMAGELRNASMLKEAPLVIVVCGDTVKSFYWYLDCAAVTQNILLAAEAQGLGAVWTAAYPYQDRMQVIESHINMPSQIRPFVVIPIGYPKGEQTVKDKYDATKVHYNDVW